MIIVCLLLFEDTDNLIGIILLLVLSIVCLAYFDDTGVFMESEGFHAFVINYASGL